MPGATNWERKERAYDNQIFWTSTHTISNPNSGYWTTRTLEYSPQIVDSGTRSRSFTPNFFSTGRNYTPPLNYSASFQKKSSYSSSRSVYYTLQSAQTGQVWVLSTDSTSFKFNVFQYSPILDPTSDSIVRQVQSDKAVNKLLENLKDSSINIAQAYAEREETIKTVTNTIKTVASTLTNLRRGNFAGAAKALGIKPPKRAGRRFKQSYASAETANDVANAVTGGWLALQYGWKPLLQDVHGAAELLAKINLHGENPNTIYAVASGRSFRKFKDRKAEVSNPGSNVRGYSQTIKTMDASIAYLYKVRYSRSSPTLKSLASVGITNPALLAWELVPYSFVVDWFLPIGNWLSGLDAAAGLTFQNGFRSRLCKYQATVNETVSLSYVDRPSSYTSSDYEARYETVTMDRSLLGNFPSAPAPRFKNPLSMSHLASAISLLKQFKR